MAELTERLPLQEQIDALREDMNDQWEMTCSMFRSFERIYEVLSKDSILSVEVMKQFSETQRGLVRYISSKEKHYKKRIGKYD